MTQMLRSTAVASGFLAATVVSLGGVPSRPRVASVPSAKEFTITARREGFNPPKIEVARGDTVRITLIAEDFPHAFTIDSYRIAKRASPGNNATVEFHADKEGRHPYYCSLTADDCCRHMHGELVVLPPH